MTEPESARSDRAARSNARAEHPVVESATFTLAALMENLRALRGRWFDVVREGDGAAGHTLEHLLGLRENSLRVPDWGEFELKTYRPGSGTLTTLLSKSPKRTGGTSKRAFLAKHGYRDSMSRIGLNCTVSSLGSNSRGWLLRVTSDNQRIDFEHCEEVVAYQDIPALADILARKVGRVVLVAAEVSHAPSGTDVRYIDAHLLSGIREEEIATLLRRGHITFDWRMYLKPDGSVRDHGPVYRLPESSMPRLYASRTELL